MLSLNHNCTKPECNGALHILDIKDITRNSRVEVLQCSDCEELQERRISLDRRQKKSFWYRAILNPFSYFVEVLKVTLIMLPATACFGAILFILLHIWGFFEGNSIKEFVLILAPFCIIVSFIVANKVISNEI